MRFSIANLYQCFNVNDAVFKPESYGIGENLGYPIECLKRELESLGHEIHTLDIWGDYQIPDAYLFIDRPANLDILPFLKSHGKKLYLIICEPELIQPVNYDPIILNYFDKVFTTRKDMVDYIRIFPYYPANKIPSNEQLQDNIDTATLRDNLCCMIAGCKMVAHPKQLYSERVRAIQWFEKNYPGQFDLYGTGWPKEMFPSYRGAVQSKSATLKKYRFQICYENAQDIQGYVTEKIFDSLFAGAIPVYLGVKNISDYVPEGCYIDKRKFKTYQHLYNHINSFSIGKYKTYLRSIYDWISKGGADLFSGEYFAKTICRSIFDD